MLSVVNDDAAAADGRSLLDEICRDGARRMLAAALEAEVDAYLAELVDERDEEGHRLVRRNGHAKAREIQTVAGADTAYSVPAMVISGNGVDITAAGPDVLWLTDITEHATAEGKLYLCLFASGGHDLRALVRNGSSDAEIASALAHIWQARGDRYSELRGSSAAVSQSLDERRVEMSYIGG